jgi:hypothetical protein
MEFLEHLRAQKLEGELELKKKLDDEQARVAAEAARVRTEEEKLRANEAEKNRKKAEAIYASLPDMVRSAASKGLPTVVLNDGSMEERPDEGKPSRAMVVNGKTYYLTGWQIPFFEKCKETGVPLTVVSEQVDVGIKSILRRQYHFLAIDLEHL